jgi:hypothetical protein
MELQKWREHTYFQCYRLVSDKLGDVWEHCNLHGEERVDYNVRLED